MFHSRFSTETVPPSDLGHGGIVDGVSGDERIVIALATIRLVDDRHLSLAT